MKSAAAWICAIGALCLSQFAAAKPPARGDAKLAVKKAKKAKKAKKPKKGRDVRVELTLVTPKRRTKVVLDTAAASTKVDGYELSLYAGNLWSSLSQLAPLSALRASQAHDLVPLESPKLVTPALGITATSIPIRWWDGSAAHSAGKLRVARRAWRAVLSAYGSLHGKRRLQLARFAAAAELALCHERYRRWIVNTGLEMVRSPRPLLLLAQRWRQARALIARLKGVESYRVPRWTQLAQLRQGRAWARLYQLGRLAQSALPASSTARKRLDKQQKRARSRALAALRLAAGQGKGRRATIGYDAKTHAKAIDKKFVPSPRLRVRHVRWRPRANGLARVLVRAGPAQLIPLERYLRWPTVLLRRPCLRSAAARHVIGALLMLRKRQEMTRRLLVLGQCWEGVAAARRPVKRLTADLHVANPVLSRAGLSPGRLLLVNAYGRVTRTFDVRRSRHRLAELLRLLRRPVARLQSPAQRRDQRLRRRLTRATSLAKRGDHGAALQNTNAALRLAPGNDDARRLRAILRARRGDLAGALRDVAWWRERYGDVAGDTLLDEVQRARRSSGRRDKRQP
jgi:hypothetical protein